MQAITRMERQRLSIFAILLNLNVDFPFVNVEHLILYLMVLQAEPATLPHKKHLAGIPGGCSKEDLKAPGLLYLPWQNMSILG